MKSESSKKKMGLGKIMRLSGSQPRSILYFPTLDEVGKLKERPKRKAYAPDDIFDSFQQFDAPHLDGAK